VGAREEGRVSDFAHAFTFMGDHVGLLWSKTLDTLALSGAAVGVALVLALPLGLWLGHLHRASFVAITASNILRALPSLAMIAIGLAIFGIGFVNVMVALVVLAFPVILANTYTAIDGVDPDVSEAARGMGMPGLEALLRVELPLALPAILAGVQIATVTVISLATVAAFVVDEGLGSPIFDAINRGTFKTELYAASALAIGLGVLAYALLALTQRLLTPWARARAN
jgi:osmoprotectant transport system permease protein